ncbi:MAG TPA: SAM-dependent DNA methyltransferase [Anaerolineae bacterium]|nr:SAM-dependent DNA methyltransferase [Anaerolineae bacterium]
MTSLDISTLESWLWDAACKLRGPVDAPKFKDYILPLVFLKRLSDVFDDEVQRVAGEFAMPLDEALNLVEQDHDLVRFYIPPGARWAHIRNLPVHNLGQQLTDAVRAVARENPRLSGVIDITDFNATTAGQRIVDDPYLHRLIQVLSQHRLGLRDVEPDILGRAYEYLLRKFAEGAGQSAGEFYTPRMVGVLMARILDPEPGMSVYDPTCGSGGLLVKTFLRFLEKYGEEENGRLKIPGHIEEIRVFGQDINASAYAMAWMNVVIHDIQDAEIRLGDTMRKPAFLDPSGRHPAQHAQEPRPHPARGPLRGRALPPIRGTPGLQGPHGGRRSGSLCAVQRSLRTRCCGVTGFRRTCPKWCKV